MRADPPWEWLDPGVLLLTRGLSLPRIGLEQAEFVGEPEPFRWLGITVGLRIVKSADRSELR